ncbi:MAG: ATP-binding protein [Myxococcota bacterium]
MAAVPLGLLGGPALGGIWIAVAGAQWVLRGRGSARARGAMVLGVAALDPFLMGVSSVGVALAVVLSVLAGLVGGRSGVVFAGLGSTAWLIADVPGAAPPDGPWVLPAVLGLAAALALHLRHTTVHLDHLAAVVKERRDVLDAERTSLADLAEQRATAEATLRHGQRLAVLRVLHGGVQHVIHNAMTVVRAASEGLGPRPGDEEVRELAREVTAAVLHVNGVLRELLVFAREDDDGGPYADAARVARELVGGLGATLSNDLMLVVDAEGSQPVATSRARLWQLVVNLLLNAQDAQPHGGRVVLAVSELGSERVQLVVSDEGPGFSAAIADRATEAFVTTRDGRQGLGLYVAQGLVDAMGGTLLLGAAGDGATVTVTLPAPQASASPAQEPDGEPSHVDIPVSLRALVPVVAMMSVVGVPLVLPVLQILAASVVVGLGDVARARLGAMARVDDAIAAARAARAVEQARLDEVQAVGAGVADEAAVGQTVGAVAHDVNNALTGVLGWAAELSDEAFAPEESDIERAEAAFEEAAADCVALVSTLGAGAPVRAWCDVGAELDRMLPLLHRVAGRERQLSCVSPPGPLGASVARTDLRRTVVNLVTNARDATPPGGTITVQASAHDGCVSLAVRDDGFGMAPDMLREVMDPFFTTKPEGQGTGLGLATVHDIATRSGGEVDIASAPGEGTVVTLRWPVRAVPVADEGPTRGVQPDCDRGGTALVVEDDERVRAVVVRCLTRAGFTVREALDGDEALERLGEPGPIEVVVADAVFPGASLATVLDATRQAQPGAVMVVASGADPAWVEVLVGERDVAFVPKPFRPSDLIRRIDAGLAARALVS